MGVIKASIGHCLVFFCCVANATEVIDTATACKNPTAWQQIIFCKKVQLTSSEKKVQRAFSKSLNEYQMNDKKVLQKDNLPSAATHFEKAQRSWAVFKEESCKAEYNYAGDGQTREIEFLDCLLKFNQERIETLKK